MSARLVSLDRARAYARIDPLESDDQVDVLVLAASQSVIAHLQSGQAYLEFLESDGEALNEDSDGVAEDVPEVVAAATLWMVAWMNRHRDEDDQKAFADGRLPIPVQGLLGPLRDPVMG